MAVSTGAGPEIVRVRNALFSLSDRTGAVELAADLQRAGAELWATEGTAAFLNEAGIRVRPLSELSGQGAWLGGRVKTLHPAILGGVLARRDVREDLEALAQRSVPPFDLVAVTLYPFEALPADASWDEAIETIDVGGVTLLRAAAKNARDVACLSSVEQYAEARRALAEQGGIPSAMRRTWAREAFERTAAYDAAIAGFFARGQENGLPDSWLRSYRRARHLRYGENPHQEAALYLDPRAGGLVSAEALAEGKELSYNNLLDLDSAVRLVREVGEGSCVIVKHNEPSGVGIGETALDAWNKAFGADPLSAFGGVVAFAGEVDEAAASALARPFLECVAAPDFTAAALDVLAQKKNLRLVRVASAASTPPRWEAREVEGGLLVQGTRTDAPGLGLAVVTARAPSPDEMEALLFAWTVVGRARSNAVVISRADRTLGVGSGQTSRIDAVQVALMKARRAGHDTAGAVLASDGFFPFDDWVAPAREAGITAVIQPGGSVRDPESIEAANAAGIAMVFTGRRQFRH